MTVDLSQFSDKYVIVTFSGGASAVVHVEKSWDEAFPYKIFDDFYTADGGPKCGFEWITEVEGPAYATHYALQSGGNSGTFIKDLAECLCNETLKDVQEYPDWNDLLRSRIREALLRKLGNIRGDLLEGIVQHIAEKARW